MQRRLFDRKKCEFFEIRVFEAFSKSVHIYSLLNLLNPENWANLRSSLTELQTLLFLLSNSNLYRQVELAQQDFPISHLILFKKFRLMQMKRGDDCRTPVVRPRRGKVVLVVLVVVVVVVIDVVVVVVVVVFVVVVVVVVVVFMTSL